MAKTTGRREWLSMVARGAAAATVGVLGQPRAARSDDGGGHPRIKHIVVLMMENRSFDHMFGLMMDEIPGLRGVRSGEWTNVDDKGNVHRADRRRGVPGAAPRRSAARFLEREPADLRAPGTAGAAAAAAGHAGIRRDLCASRRQPGQHHEMLQPGATCRPSARWPRTTSCATTGSPRCRARRIPTAPSRTSGRPSAASTTAPCGS